MRHTNRLIFSVAAAISALLCAGAPALAGAPYTDDTEVFFDQSNNATSNPNVLFMLDTGNEMGVQVTTPTGPKTRMQIVKDALMKVLTDIDTQGTGINAGLMRLSVNGSGNSAAAKGGLVVRAVSPVNTALLADFRYALCLPSSTTARDVLIPSSDCLRSFNNAGSDSRFVFGTQNQFGSGAYASPLTEMLFEAYLYYAGKGVLWGGSQGQVGPGWDFRSEPNSITPATCGAIVNDKNGNPSCSSGANQGIYKTPATQACQTNFIILLSNGVMAEDKGNDTGGAEKNVQAQPNMAGYPGPNTDGTSKLGACSLNYEPGTTKEIEFSGSKKVSSCPDDLAYYMDQYGVGARKVPVTTYVIGFDVNAAAGVDAVKATNLLQLVARAGGGKFFTANDQAALEDVFRGILDEIVIQNASFTSPAVAVNAFNRTQNLDSLYMSVFAPKTSIRWPGNIKKYKLASNGDILDADNNSAVGSNGFFRAGRRSIWTATGTTDGDDVTKGGAASKIPAAASRNIYTNTTNGTSQLVVDNALASHNLSAIKSLSSTTKNSLLGITCTSQTTPIASAFCPSADQLIDWAYGADVTDVVPALGNGNYAEARKDMGDPLHARPAVVIYGGTTASPNVNDARVFAVTNDGYLHSFDAATGVEQWAFIPWSQLTRLLTIYRNSPDNPRNPLGLDGSIRVLKIDRCLDGVIDTSTYNASSNPCGGDKVYLYFGMRRGGSYYYGLDVSIKDAPKLIWINGPSSDTSISASNRLPLIGQTWSTPSIAKANVPGGSQNADKWVLIFGGGYDSAIEDGIAPKEYQTDTVGTGIYIVDALDGTLLWRAGPSGSSPDLTLTSMTNAIPADVRPIDFTGDGFVDLVYAADLGGRVWRLEVNNSATVMSDFIKGGVFASLGATGSATTARRFFVAPDVSFVKVGTATWFNIAIGSGNRELPVTDTVTDDKFYSLRDYNKLAPYTWSGGGAWTPLTDASSTDLSLTDVTPVATTVDGVTTYSQPPVAANAAGWKLPLNYFAGEKVVTESRTFENTVFFSTFYPKTRTGTDDTDSNACTTTKGYNNLYTISAVNGTRCASCISGLVTKGKEEIPSGLGVILKQPGIAPEPVFLFPTPEGGSTVRVPPICLVGAESCGTFNSFEPKRTYWLQKGAQ